MSVPQASWEERYEQEGFTIQHKQLVSVDMDYVFEKKQGSYEYLEKKSIELMKNGVIPESFSTRTLRRAKKGQIEFCRAFSLALILREDAKEADIELNLRNVIMVDQVKNSAGAEVSVSRDISRDFEIWIKVVGFCALATICIYTLAIALGLSMNIGFPIAGIFISGLAAFLAHKKSKYPMPLNLQIVAGLIYGIISGGASFYAHSIIQPDTLCEFSDGFKQIAAICYIFGCIFSFLAGKALNKNFKQYTTKILLFFAILATTMSIILALIAPPC